MSKAPRHFTPRTLPARDVIAMGSMLTDIHAAIVVVPGDPTARSMVELLQRYGIYRRDASTFTAREGGNPLTPRGRRIFSLIPPRKPRRRKP